MKETFGVSENTNVNYQASICKVGEIIPIEGSDHLCKTIVNGYTIVVSNDFKKGDIVIYFPVETAICDEFLSANNLYELHYASRNKNRDAVLALKEKAENAKKDGDLKEYNKLYSEAKSMVGFFSDKARVRIIKLRGVYSEGFITSIDSMVQYDASLAEINWEEFVGTRFDCVNGHPFCWKYIPPMKPIEVVPCGRQSFFRKRMKRLRTSDLLIPGQFEFHYDTEDLAPKIDLLKPDDIVTITVKCDGTSVILSNVQRKRELSLWEKIKKKIGLKVKDEIIYDNIWSSRNVIKNDFFHKNGQQQHYYGVDIWGCAEKVFGPYIPQGTTIYGEIVGYLEHSDIMIQANHDYGCKPGQWKLMPYRITETDSDGNKKEWNVLDVDRWTHNLVNEHPELEQHILYLNILYHGRMADLYPDLDISCHWHENLLERLKNDKESFLMEEKEPMCHLYDDKLSAIQERIEENRKKNKSTEYWEKKYAELDKFRAPREGIVIRIDDDIIPRAWKLKTNAHYEKERQMHDDGVSDIEEQN